MRPILLKGHEGPISKLKYNREGDLLFTCARKDKSPCAWYTENGERVGTYEGHEGAVWDIDCSWDTTRLLTASGDRTARLWDVQFGTELYRFDHMSPVRACGFADGGRMIFTAQEDTMSQPAALFIYNLAEDSKEQDSEPLREMCNPDSGKIYSAEWGALNQYIITANGDGSIRKWNVETGVEEKKVLAHTKEVRCLQFSPDKTMFATASTDKTAKLWDAATMKPLKVFKSDRPLNAVSISPLMTHVIVGGGQEALHVTTTSAKQGHFEVDFFHMVYAEYMGNVKGHFGPVNTLSFSPDGKGYASGGEDGYVRLHHFDKDYLSPKVQYW